MTSSVSLIFPPYWSFQEPHLALPSLAGHLRARGAAVRVFDLNVRAVDRLFSADFMGECAQRIGRRLTANPGAVDSTGTPLRQYLAAAEVVAVRLDACKEAVRTDYDPQAGAVAHGVFDHTMEVVSAAFSPSSVARRHHHFRDLPIQDLLLARELSKDGSANIFGALFEQSDIEAVLAGSPDLVGLSLAALNQLVPALTLIDRIKASAPDVPIVVGGTMVLYLYELAERRPELFDGVDFMVVGEGETALVHLLEALRSVRPMESVENLLFRRGGRFLTGRIGHVEDVQKLGPPDFDGMPWDTYFSPTRVVPYLASRGCYWDRCAFCSLCATYMNKYRERSVDRVLADLRHLSGIGSAGQCFVFNDECFSPRRLRTISRALIDADLKIEWDILARFEKSFTSEDFALAAKAGLNWITWGLESGSPHVLDLMNKGTRPGVASRLIREADSAGLWNNVLVLLGFPGETDEDYLQTKEFVRQNSEHIDSLGYGLFLLEKGAPIFADWQKYGITLVDTSDTFVDPVFPFDYGPRGSDNGPAKNPPTWLFERVADFERFLQQETRCSSLLIEGMTPANLKAALHHFGGKTELRRFIEERARYYGAVFLEVGWHRNERLQLAPHSRHQTGCDDATLLFAHRTGRIVTVNSSGLALLQYLGQGLPLPEALARRNLRAPTEAELNSAVPFVWQLLWRGLLEPLGGGSLPFAPVMSTNRTHRADRRPAGVPSRLSRRTLGT